MSMSTPSTRVYALTSRWSVYLCNLPVIMTCAASGASRSSLKDRLLIPVNSNEASSW